MTGVPKPTKKERILAEQEVKAALRTYRSVQVGIAIYRDNDQCVFCWFLLGKRVPRQEVHHVFSRGTEAGDWREHYRSMVCTCKKHHPLAIQVPGASANLSWVEGVLKQANETPINWRFRHEDFPQHPQILHPWIYLARNIEHNDGGGFQPGPGLP